MSRLAFLVVSILLAVGSLAAPARAEDVSARKLLIKDNDNAAKRQVQVQSRDAGVQIVEADDPSVSGAAVHVYSATDDFCAILGAGSDWRTNGKKWKYKSKATKNSALVGDGKLKIKIKSGVTYTLADDGSQGVVNAEVQFGTGTRYCMRCTGNKKDDGKKFQAKNCAASPCDVEPSLCDSTVTTTTTTTTTLVDAATNVTPVACDVTAAELAAMTAPHQYVESDDGVTRTITANGIPDHDVGTFPNAGNPNTITAQSYHYTMPVGPSGAGEDLVKVFAIAESGVVFDPYTAEFWNDDPNWRYEALRYATAPDYFGNHGGDDSTMHPNSLGVDCNYAHVQPNGAYHYHGIPEKMLPASPALTFLGWAADGYPVFGRWGYVDANDSGSGLKVMTSSYHIKSGSRGPGAPSGDYDGTFVADWEYQPGLGDLDECNGRTGVVTVDGSEVTTYHYYVTDSYPYIPHCFHAAPDSSFDAGGPPPP
jgi:hypothetical protein